ncbi:FadR/GntR family transcriptional regulator [Carbonactinospora thermoautotrophica]|uniref:FadR/GntR family transcriptional regulator n=1 Tax=Carbonactinospora thermoautotrophica TaxID=1469144 RepID=UPI0008351B39
METGRVTRKPTAHRGRGLHGQVVQQLGQMIVAGEFDGRQPLVPEEIGQSFDVSRTVVRESLRVLEAKGLVSARPNVGTRVRPVSDWNLLDPDVIDWRAHGPQRQEQMRELQELRLAIEPLAARLASLRAPEEARTQLSTALRAMREAAERRDYPLYIRAHVDFHRALLSAPGNRMLQHLAGSVAVALQMRDEYPRPDSAVLAEEVDRHGRLVEVIADADQEAAERIARDLVEHEAVGAVQEWPLAAANGISAHGTATG